MRFQSRHDRGLLPGAARKNMACRANGGRCADGPSATVVWPDRRAAHLRRFQRERNRNLLEASVGFRGTLSSFRGRAHRLTNEERLTMARNVICLWYDG